MKVDIKATIKMELIPMCSISVNSRTRKIPHFSGFDITIPSINIYFPIFGRIFIVAKLMTISFFHMGRLKTF
jgi:hypothetical protein